MGSMQPTMSNELDTLALDCQMLSDKKKKKEVLNSFNC